MSTLKVSRNANLNTQLSLWSSQLSSILDTSDVLSRSEQIDAFVQGFVPLDVGPEDIASFASSLKEDAEFLESMTRELLQCTTGQNVEKIKGNETTKAIYTLLPMDGQLGEEQGQIDIVREVCFVSTDNGNTWRAEG